MECKLRFSSEAGTPRIIVDGSWPSKPGKLIEDIRNLWTRQPGKQLILDIRSMEGPSTIVGDYEDVKRFFDAGFRKLGKVAILDKLYRQKDNDFFEIAANNRGLNFRFFYGDEKDAIDWLNLEGSDPV